MDMDQALRAFRIYCYRLEKHPAEAESLLLTGEEKLAIRELKELTKQYGYLFETEGKELAEAA